ncbi:MAG: hypothetical protein LBH25_12900 [Fibromonadaceae bacterium]|nr:hypothetical protein [Fibromonadaceae bacterium]
MKTNRFLLAASIVLTLFMFSCSGGSSPSAPPENSAPSENSDVNGPWTGCKASGICTAVNIDKAESECQALGGTLDNSCVFKHCKYAAGTCTPMAEAAQQLCQMGGGTIVDVSQCDYAPPSNPGGNQLPSDGRYCYDDEGDCTLIGTSSKCLYGSKEECEYFGDGTVKTLQWCQANAGSSNGCVF